MIDNFLNFYFPEFILGMKEEIFGDVKSKSNSAINTILTFGREFIWMQKFTSKNINELQYIIYMRKKLELLLHTMDFRGVKNDFLSEWSAILEHFEVY